MARVLGPKRESPGTAGPTRGPSDSSVSSPGQLVNTEGLRTEAPVTQDSWATRWALAHKCECPGELVESACPRSWAGIARDS